MINNVSLVGRLVREVELRYTPNGKAVMNNALAVDRPGTSGENKQTDFIDIVLWNQPAEFAAKYGGKGRLCAVTGQIQVRSFETQDGQKRKAVEVVCREFRLLDRPKEQQQQDDGAGQYHERQQPRQQREPAYSGGSGGDGFDGGDDIPF